MHRVQSPPDLLCFKSCPELWSVHFVDFDAEVRDVGRGGRARCVFRSLLLHGVLAFVAPRRWERIVVLDEAVLGEVPGADAALGAVDARHRTRPGRVSADSLAVEALAGVALECGEVHVAGLVIRRVEALEGELLLDPIEDSPRGGTESSLISLMIRLRSVDSC